MVAYPVSSAGSSPRGRGKLFFTLREALLAGLIPARAGKTVLQRWKHSVRKAHPRAGGENERRRTLFQECDRLIPARAGKTR